MELIQYILTANQQDIETLRIEVHKKETKSCLKGTQQLMLKRHAGCKQATVI